MDAIWLRMDAICHPIYGKPKTESGACAPRSDMLVRAAAELQSVGCMEGPIVVLQHMGMLEEMLEGQALLLEMLEVEALV